MLEPYYCQRCKKLHKPGTRDYNTHKFLDAWDRESDVACARTIVNRVLLACIAISATWVVAMSLVVYSGFSLSFLFGFGSVPWIGFVIGFAVAYIVIVVVFGKGLQFNTSILHALLQVLGFLIVLPTLPYIWAFLLTIPLSIMALQATIALAGWRRPAIIAEPWLYKGRWFLVTLGTGAAIALLWLLLLSWLLHSPLESSIFLLFFLAHSAIAILFTILSGVVTLGHIDKLKMVIKESPWMSGFKLILDFTARDTGLMVISIIFLFLH
nr:hypothetical protein [Candidatus Sigynarchaeota archaeon]